MYGMRLVDTRGRIVAMVIFVVLPWIALGQVTPAPAQTQDPLDASKLGRTIGKQLRSGPKTLMDSS